ncbi:hypothetical protein HanIR_Chr09g0444021 [Helianthus annuus]|nr:hypothetical protein HanIR_Chr09g0444021 [Helianthus annuus]
MSDQWPADSKDVPVLMFNDREAQLFQAAFPNFGGSMSVRPLQAGEEYWYHQIRGNFMYPVADAFASPPIATEGAQIPKPRPLRSVTSAGKEVVYLSSEESVGSSNGELSPWSNIFAGVLRDLGIDPEDKKKKPLRKKKVVNLDPEVTSKGTGSSHATAGAAGKGLSRAAEKKTGAGGSKSSGSAGSRNPNPGATSSTDAHEEEEEEEVTEKLISRKRTRSETTTGVASTSVAGAIPLIGKTSNLRSLYKFSPETKKKTPEKGVTFTESEPKRPKITIKSSKTVGAESAKNKNVAEVDKAKAAEEKRKVDEERRKKAEEEKKKKTEEDKKAEEAKRKKASDMEKEKERKKVVEEPIDDLEFVITTGPERPHQERRKEPEFEKPIHPTHSEVPDRTKVTSTRGSGRYVSSGASSGGAGGYNPQVIGAKDTLGDITIKVILKRNVVMLLTKLPGV